MPYFKLQKGKGLKLRGVSAPFYGQTTSAREIPRQARNDAWGNYMCIARFSVAARQASFMASA